MAAAVRSRRVVTPDGTRPATVHVEGGRIARVGPHDDAPAAAAAGGVLDAGDLVLLPGLVDTHVHVNEPGRTEWEGFETATRAAAAGGVTTLLDMPLNSIPATTSVDALRAKADAARGRAWVDVGFIGGVVPGNAEALGPLREAGVLAFKCFLVPSGVEEFPHVGMADLRAALPELARLGAVLMVHAEAPEEVERATRAARDPAAGADPRRYATYLASRPPSSEGTAVARMVRLAKETGARVHVVHLSSGMSVPLVRGARAHGLAVSAETCPHYLALDAAEIADGATEFKCAPPIRGRADRDALWAALDEGAVDMIVSDHSPCPPAMKGREAGDFFAAWGGIASLQLGLSVVWTEMRARGIPVERVARWMSEAPARLVGLGERKGRIAAGFDADFVLFDPDAERVVDPAALLHRHPVTPYAGRRLFGSVEATYLRGSLAYDRRDGPARTPAGELLLP
ncbi:MAG TPA: allantoinase AllB [Gemmatimonadaceae bacterium]|nr:allantoinase AllB [Gemmatimonadaceae bacterium]